MNNPYIISDSSATFLANVNNQVKVVTVNSGHSNFSAVVAAIYAGDFEEAERLSNLELATERWGKGNITVKNGVIHYKDTVIDNTLTHRIIAMMKQDLPVEPLLNFIGRVMENPSSRAVNELYQFLEHSNLPITPDGHFLAYKRVRDDFRDCYSGTMDNSPGQTVEMPRNMVNDDCSQTCSHGLHFAAFDYLKHFGGSRLVILLIDPKDVVSIPLDYNNTKGRCCKYKVLQEIPMPDSWKEQHFDSLVYDEYEDDECENDDNDEYENDNDDDVKGVFSSFAKHLRN